MKLEIKKLNVSVKEKNILNDFSLTINKGEVHAIMGPNGTGKSTLSKVIMGDENYHINSGDILVDGKTILNLATDERARLGIFLCYQSPISIDGITRIKRTKQLVPRPVRLVNNLPFDRVSTVGFKNNREIPFIKETTARFSAAVPGLKGMPRYDYINGYIYIFPLCGKPINFDKIIIESAFEHPNPIDIENGVTTNLDVMMDENEYLLSEDMIGQIKEIIYKRDLLQNIRETNEHSINTEVI